MIVATDKSANRHLEVLAWTPTLGQLQVENKLAPEPEPGFLGT